MSLANTNVELPYIIGEVCDIRITVRQWLTSEDATLCVSVFDSVAELLHKRLEAGVVHQKVMVATNINPKFVGVNMHLQKKERNFADWILEVWNGTAATVESLSDKHREGDQIATPTKFMIPNSEQPERSLTDAAYPDFINK
ncbi:hypothetical protein YC2023_018845 [Brassica napus]